MHWNVLFNTLDFYTTEKLRCCMAQGQEETWSLKFKDKQ